MVSEAGSLADRADPTVGGAPVEALALAAAHLWPLSVDLDEAGPVSSMASRSHRYIFTMCRLPAIAGVILCPGCWHSTLACRRRASAPPSAMRRARARPSR